MASRVTALIAEDEPLMRERLKDKLEEVWPELDVVAEAEDGDQAVAMFDEHQPQIAFLDIRMPGRSGLDVAAAIGARCHVVFITAYDQYAVKAFEAGAADYLLKPVETDRLLAMKERMERKIATPPIDLSALVAQLRVSVKGDAGRMKWVKAAVGKQVDGQHDQDNGAESGLTGGDSFSGCRRSPDRSCSAWSACSPRAVS